MMTGFPPGVHEHLQEDARLVYQASTAYNLAS